MNNLNDIRSPLSFSMPENWHIVREASCAYLADKDGAEISSGCVIADYELLETIGSGGSCLCYRALNLRTGQIVILKELYPFEFAQKGLVIRSGPDLLPAPYISGEDRRTVLESYARGFAQESTVTASILYSKANGGVSNDPRYFSSHVIEWSERERAGALNTNYLVIDTHAGSPLSELRLETQGAERVLECLELTSRILEALQDLHENKHRLHLDISPSNIYVSDLKVGTQTSHGGNVVILIDFGSSFALDGEGKVIRSGGVFSASPGYAAPELSDAAADTARIGVHTDLYSVAKVLQELLVRDCPSKARSWQLRARQDPHIQALPKPVAEELVRKVGSLTASSEGRAQSIAEMQHLLASLRNDILSLGVSRAIIAAQAEKIAQGFTGINRDLLCEVEIV